MAPENKNKLRNLFQQSKYNVIVILYYEDMEKHRCIGGIIPFNIAVTQQKADIVIGAVIIDKSTGLTRPHGPNTKERKLSTGIEESGYVRKHVLFLLFIHIQPIKPGSAPPKLILHISRKQSKKLVFCALMCQGMTEGGQIHHHHLVTSYNSYFHMWVCVWRKTNPLVMTILNVKTESHGNLVCCCCIFDRIDYASFHTCLLFVIWSEYVVMIFLLTIQDTRLYKKFYL